MKKNILFSILVFSALLSAAAQTAGDGAPSGSLPDPETAVPDDAGTGAPGGDAAPRAVTDRVLNNDYYLQSLRFSGLARNSYETGDYDAAEAYSEEAMRYSRLSDAWVANWALGAAQARLNWAASDRVRADTRWPQAYQAALAAFQEARDSNDQELFSETVDAANRVFLALSAVTREGDEAVPAGVFPARYTVRSWSSVRDCLWNIAGRPWAYGNPWEWRRLYEANRDRLPDPRNPNHVEPGTVLEIPPLRGEVRRGEWSPAGSYPAMR